jgi:hypothetical protein
MIPSPTHWHFNQEGEAIRDKENEMVFYVTWQFIKTDEIMQAVQKMQPN